MLLPPNEVQMLSKNQLTQSDIEYFREKYGKQFVRALRAVEENKVLRYHFRPSEVTRWAIRGKLREYLIIPETFCTCRSFYHSVVMERDKKMCYHLLAQKIAEIRSEYQSIESNDADRRKLSIEWRRTD